MNLLHDEGEGQDQPDRLPSVSTAHRSERQVIATRIGGPGVQVFSRRCHAAVAQRGLNKVDWATSIQSVGSMSMAEPMAGHVFVDASPFGRFGDDSPHLGFVQVTFLPASEDGSVGRSITL